MLKKVLKLDGAQALNKKEQNEINGGWDTNFCTRFCPTADPNDWRYAACNCDDSPIIED